ncbi:MAG TPA: hypothetical protein PKD90_12620 [Phnomibacter sp.]|nr:hypothetical protein [Phnomibacter sp.]
MKQGNSARWWRNVLLTFWFAWLAIAGVVATGLVNWVAGLQLGWYNVLIIGSLLGVTTAGLAALFMLLLLRRRRQQGLGGHGMQ